MVSDVIAPATARPAALVAPLIVPSLTIEPEPLTTPENVPLLESNTSVALSVTLPVIEPVAPPLPIWSVPAVIVVPPV